MDMYDWDGKKYGRPQLGKVWNYNAIGLGAAHSQTDKR